MKIYFTIEAGLLNRRSVRNQLENSKSKLQYWYPGCCVLLTENKGLFESEFHFEAKNITDSAKDHMTGWLKNLNKLVINIIIKSHGKRNHNLSINS